mgnify:FL=1|jgi:hypothetical protein|nr:MAG TPA: tRNA Pseudouridine synthase II, C terminal [Caudoviricetes sp.]
MTKFIYKGPLAAVTIKDGKETRDVILANGQEIDLPEKNNYVRTLIEKGRLIAVETKKKGG